jgi:hypothetical protein
MSAKLQVNEPDGNYWEVDIDGEIDGEKVINTIDPGTRFIVFKTSDGGMIVLNLQYVKNFQVIPEETQIV